MSYIFGDGFDLYQQLSDAYGSGTYWDSGSNTIYEVSTSGRSSGSRGIMAIATSATTVGLSKSSGSNDAVHHINLAYYTPNTLTGTNKNAWLTLFDGTTAQCTIVFRSDGALLLYSGNAASSTVLATYTGAVAAASTWYSFEIEVVIDGSAGSFKVRKNGNTSNDHSTTGLNTKPGTNAYANKLSIGNGAGTGSIIDDLLWRSDASSVSWIGDVRAYTRLPASDAAAAWTRSGSTVPVTPFAQGGTASIAATSARYQPFIATCSGTLGSVVVSLNAGYTGNMKCTLFADNSGVPGSVVGSATAISNPVTGNNTFMFASPPSVVQGTKYWIGFDSDTSVTSGWNVTTNTGITGAYNNVGASATVAYASFPTANPSVSGTVQPVIFTASITPTTAANANLVAEVAQDGAGSYVYSSNVSDQDLYALQSISGTPTSIVAVTTRVIAQKSDAGTRNIGVQLKSNTTTSNGTSTALGTAFGHIYRTDTVDPDTGTAWTATGVNNLQVGVKVTA